MTQNNPSEKEMPYLSKSENARLNSEFSSPSHKLIGEVPAMLAQFSLEAQLHMMKRKNSRSLMQTNDDLLYKSTERYSVGSFSPGSWNPSVVATIRMDSPPKRASLSALKQLVLL